LPEFECGNVRDVLGVDTELHHFRVGDCDLVVARVVVNGNQNAVDVEVNFRVEDDDGRARGNRHRTSGVELGSE